MPLYDYYCEEHGAFTALRPMSAYAEPCECPDCGASAPRVMLTAPRLGLLDTATRTAHAVNERSAHEPKRASSHGHGPGCGCCGGGTAKKGRKTLHRPDGSKSFPSARPWMISH
ncbi:FmdB family zinc ribbon protein [Amorphus orientalis]|uniref:FmdB family regulatory protein n=1 Tax=Amorphus orientalis TaxID=649198 RepID=A0AAE3VUE7_9HYPH|nr:zinc ribbon domain-containing protein [Amorphus orientalis]MDQ0317796.1 putative FmdB family regulatory protein [Amorphus orientalis]